MPLSSTGVSHHPQLSHHAQELVKICPSGLSHEDPGTAFQLHVIWRPLYGRHPRVRVTVEVEHHLVVLQSDCETGPGVPHGRHLETGRFVGLLRVGLRVVQDDVLFAPPHRRQLDSHVHHLLRGVGDGENDATPVGGGFHVEDEGEVSVERIGEVGLRQLTRVGVGAKDVAGGVVRSEDSSDLIWRRISNQLQQ